MTPERLAEIEAARWNPKEAQALASLYIAELLTHIREQEADISRLLNHQQCHPVSKGEECGWEKTLRTANTELGAENTSLREALAEVAKGAGAYSHDPLTHATNTIESMKAIAIAALAAHRNSAGGDGGAE